MELLQGCNFQQFLLEASDTPHLRSSFFSTSHIAHFLSAFLSGFSFLSLQKSTWIGLSSKSISQRCCCDTRVDILKAQFGSFSVHDLDRNYRSQQATRFEDKKSKAELVLFGFLGRYFYYLCESSTVILYFKI